MASINLQGDTSGSISISAPSVAGSNTLTLPATTQTLATQNALGVRNLIINGDMKVDQRNAGASVTANDYVYYADRWKFLAQLNGKMSIQQVTDAPTGFSNSLLFTTTSAYTPPSSSIFAISQWIEGYNTAHLSWGTANAKTVTLSFWVKSSLTGTFGGALQNSAANRSYPFEYTISSANTWEKKTITVSGDTTGTWIGSTNGTGLKVIFSLGAGATFSDTAGAWSGTSNIYSATGAVQVVATGSATWNVTGVQLEVGDTATPFEHRPYDMELARCQRYYEKSGLNNAISWSGDTTNGSNYWDVRAYMIEKRTAPTVTVGTEYARNGFASAPNISWEDTRSFRAYKSANATTAGGYFVFGWTAEAEL